MASKPMVVSGVNMGAVKIALVERRLEAFGLQTGGTEAHKVARLSDWYQKHAPKNRIADCTTCGGESDTDEPACPFCGDGEVEAPKASGAAQGASGKALTPPPPPPAKPVAVKTPPPPPVPADAAGKGLVRVTKTSARVPPPPGSATELALPATEEALDEHVAEVRVLMASAADRLWELGFKLKAVFDSSLWTQRKADGGGDKYKSWGQFCEAELSISHGYSLKLMDVVREFTREQVKQIGASKLYITLQVPKGEARDRLLGIAPSVSRRELEEKAAEAGKEKRETGRTGKGGAGTHKPGAAKGGRKPEKITVAMLTTRVELQPVNEKGLRVKVKIPSPLAAEERMFNGVKQRIVITNDESGHVLIVIERVRE